MDNIFKILSKAKREDPSVKFLIFTPPRIVWRNAILEDGRRFRIRCSDKRVLGLDKNGKIILDYGP